jgi:hypothetical protein
MKNVLLDNVGRIVQHDLDVFGRKLGVVIVNNDLTPLAPGTTNITLLAPLLSGLLGRALLLVTIKIEATNANGVSATITSGVETKLKARIASVTAHRRGILNSVIEVHAEFIVIIRHWKSPLGHIIRGLAGHW